VSRTAMAPLERVKMDLLLKTSSRSAMDTAVWVWQREGLAGFWKGNGLNLLRTAPFKVRPRCGHQGGGGELKAEWVQCEGAQARCRGPAVVQLGVGGSNC
jgi:hypothetical protein